LLVGFNMKCSTAFKGQPMYMFLLLVDDFVPDQIEQVIQAQSRVGNIDGQAVLRLITQACMPHRRMKFELVHVDSLHVEQPLAGPPAFRFACFSVDHERGNGCKYSHRTCLQQAVQVLDYVAKLSL
jgi:hypothetical protein